MSKKIKEIKFHSAILLDRNTYLYVDAKEEGILITLEDGVFTLSRNGESIQTSMANSPWWKLE